MRLHDAFDAVIVLRRDVSLKLNHFIPIFMFTDSNKLFFDLVRGKRTAEKWLMIDILGARGAHKRYESYAVGLVPSDQNNADGLTKETNNRDLGRILVFAVDTLMSVFG